VRGGGGGGGRDLGIEALADGTHDLSSLEGGRRDSSGGAAAPAAVRAPPFLVRAARAGVAGADQVQRARVAVLHERRNAVVLRPPAAQCTSIACHWAAVAEPNPRARPPSMRCESECPIAKLAACATSRDEEPGCLLVERGGPRRAGRPAIRRAAKDDVRRLGGSPPRRRQRCARVTPRPRSRSAAALDLRWRKSSSLTAGGGPADGGKATEGHRQHGRRRAGRGRTCAGMMGNVAPRGRSSRRHMTRDRCMW